MHAAVFLIRNTKKPEQGKERGHVGPAPSLVCFPGGLVYFSVAAALSSFDMAERRSTSFISRPSSPATRLP